jgi:hypothetical protein
VRAPYKCLRCGLVNAMGSLTCHACGASLTGASSSVPPAAAASSARSGVAFPSSQSFASNQIVSSGAPAAVAASGVTLAPAPSKVSALAPFGWRSLHGRVIHVDQVYMGTPDVRWARLLVKLSVVGGAVYYYGTLLLVLLVLLCVAGWLFSKVFSGGFLSAVAVQVTSFFLTRRLMGPVANVPIRDFRIRDSHGLETLVRIKGQLISGGVTVGDDVLVEGWERAGMIMFRRGHNNRIRADIRVRPA